MNPESKLITVGQSAKKHIVVPPAAFFSVLKPGGAIFGGTKKLDQFPLKKYFPIFSKDVGYRLKAKVLFDKISNKIDGNIVRSVQIPAELSQALFVGRERPNRGEDILPPGKDMQLP
jgi:hypothetical protein